MVVISISEVKMPDQFKFRFTGPMPRGKTEYQCTCGEYVALEIEPGVKEKNADCTNCGKHVQFLEQRNHWHMFIG